MLCARVRVWVFVFVIGYCDPGALTPAPTPNVHRTVSATFASGHVESTWRLPHAASGCDLSRYPAVFGEGYAIVASCSFSSVFHLPRPAAPPCLSPGVLCRPQHFMR
ncbi:unnamed protein product [Prorocentrum cordatum]|uniref:Secreted protein n=1 Tax=Prorocentrum cordatum TaxID=2364126 RepID=A0ABN9U768_9DINO|nr:unnamed protein product [Polarella glacialis]